MQMTNRGLLFSFLFAGTVLLGISSCKKEKSTNNPVPPPAAAKLKEYRDGEEFVRFSYNPDGSIKKAVVKSELNTGGEVADFNITYNAQKKIAEVITSLGGKIVPEYDNNLVTRVNYFDGAVRVSYTNYHYEAGLMKRATVYVNDGQDFKPAFEFKFSYNANGNISESLVMMATDVPGQLVRAGHVTYQYDQKVNPLYQHRDFMLLLLQGMSKNNITKEEHFDKDMNLEDVYNYVYTYKANGLPEKAVVTSGLPGQPPVTSAVDFFYEP